MKDLVYRVIVAGFRLMFSALGLRIRVQGSQFIPTRGAAVIASNHISFLDFTFVGLPAAQRGRLIRFMAKNSTFNTPVAGYLMRVMRHIPVDRSLGATAYLRAATMLRGGELVGVFPEATISRAWTLKPFKLGAATLAVSQRVPAVPVVVWGSQRILTVDGHRSLRRGKAITILVGEPLLAAVAESPIDFDARLRLAMQLLLDAAQRDYPDRPAPGRSVWWQPRQLGGSAPTPEQAAVLDAAGVARADAAAAGKPPRQSLLRRIGTWGMPSSR